MRRELGDHHPSVRLEDPIGEDGYQRQLGRIETEPGVTIPFWLLSPLHKSTSLQPLAICAHGHDSDGWNTYAGCIVITSIATALVRKMETWACRP